MVSTLKQSELIEERYKDAEEKERQLLIEENKNIKELLFDKENSYSYIYKELCNVVSNKIQLEQQIELKDVKHKNCLENLVKENNNLNDRN